MSRLPEWPAQHSTVGRKAPGEQAPVSGGLLRAAQKVTSLLSRDGEGPAYASYVLTEADPPDSLC